VARMLSLSRPVAVDVVPQQELVFHETVGEGTPSSTAAHGVAQGYPARALERCGRAGAKTFSSGSPGAEGPVPRQQQDQRSQAGRAEAVG